MLEKVFNAWFHRRALSLSRVNFPLNDGVLGGDFSVSDRSIFPVIGTVVSRVLRGI